LNTTSFAPASLARTTELAKVKRIRIKAIRSQSQRGPTSWVIAPIDAKQKAAVSIQAAGNPAGGESGSIVVSGEETRRPGG
jgi:hypothetical protein